VTSVDNHSGASLSRVLRINAFAGRKVLVADDDRSSIARVREGLAADGYVFDEAYDGAGALARIRDAKPDLLLIDVEMPRLSGVEVCRIVKANQGEAAFGFLPVILMTARSSTRKVESLELGADDYLTKPFDMLELSARVKSMLRLKVLQDELLTKCQDLDKINRVLERKSQELELLSRTDALTGLFNRRYFEERFYAELARSQRYRSPICCVMLDVDHFKRINDTRGHQAGDKVLKELGHTLRRTLRDVDLVARYGGEEFVAALPQTGIREGAIVAERLREEIAAKPVEHESGAILVTISAGVATYPAPNIADTEALLRAADDALYRAKRTGRNRIACHED